MSSREAIVMENSPLSMVLVHCQVRLWFYAGFINFNNFDCLLFFKIKLILKIEKMQSLISIEEMVFRGKLIIQELMAVCFGGFFLQIHVGGKKTHERKNLMQSGSSLIKEIKMFSFQESAGFVLFLLLLKVYFLHLQVVTCMFMCFQRHYVSQGQ